MREYVPGLDRIHTCTPQVTYTIPTDQHMTLSNKQPAHTHTHTRQHLNTHIFHIHPQTHTHTHTYTCALYLYLSTTHKHTHTDIHKWCIYTPMHTHSIAYTH